MSTNTITMSRESLALIRSIARICGAIPFKAGNKVRVISAGETIIADLEIPETFPVDFAIAEVQKMIGMSDLKILHGGETVDMQFSDSHLIFKNNGNKVRYRYTNRRIVAAPDGDIVVNINPAFDVDIDSSTLKDILDTASSLKLNLVYFTATEEDIRIRATNPELGDESNDFEVVVGPNDRGLEPCEFLILLENLILFPGDYSIRIDEAGFAQFECTSLSEGTSLVYTIGVEVEI